MAKFDKTIIVTDLDGTFFDDNSNLVQKNVDAIKYFTANGGHFSFSTGRNEGILKKIIPDTIRLNNMPAILSNGAYLYDFSRDTRISEVVLNNDFMKEFIESIEKKFSNIGIRWNVECGFVTYDPEKICAYDLPCYHNTLPEYTREQIFSNKIYKAVISSDVQTMSEIKKYADSINEHGFSVVLSAPRMLEIMDKGATKGKALTKLKQYLGIPDAVVYAIGDYENDYDMLKSADVAACPSNALDKIKEISDIIVCSNNDGALADLISRL